jgi:hypothetical protein
MNCLCWLKIHKELNNFWVFLKSFSLNKVFLNFQTKLNFVSKAFKIKKRVLENISTSNVLLVIAVSLVCSWNQKTCWKTPREGYDEHNSKFPSVVKPRFIEPVGERTKLPKVDAR